MQPSREGYPLKFKKSWKTCYAFSSIMGKEEVFYESHPFSFQKRNPSFASVIF